MYSMTEYVCYTTIVTTTRLLHRSHLSLYPFGLVPEQLNIKAAGACKLHVPVQWQFRDFKKWRPNFRWLLVLNGGGSKLSFLIFSYGENCFLAKGGHGPMAP